MISTELSADESYVEHVAQGTLDLKDIGQAALDASHRDLPVLWDLSAAILDAPDAFYSVGSGSVLNKLEQTGHRRGFVVGSELHQQRVTNVLSALNVPWPWQVFMCREEAITWIIESP